MGELVELDGGHDADTATLLLDAAETLGFGVSVVRTTTDGFLVPREVAEAAGFLVEDGGTELSFRTKKEAEAYADENGLDVDKSLNADDYKAAVVAAANQGA